MPLVEWGQKASPLGKLAFAKQMTEEVPLRWLRAFIVAEARGVAFREDLFRLAASRQSTFPIGGRLLGTKIPEPKLGVGWSFSGAELPWIHPWGLVLSIHAALGDRSHAGPAGSQQPEPGWSRQHTGWWCPCRRWSGPKRLPLWVCEAMPLGGSCLRSRLMRSPYVGFAPLSWQRREA